MRIVLAALLALMLPACATASAKVGAPAPGFSLPAVPKPVSLRDLRGEKVVLIFFRSAT